MKKLLTALLVLIASLCTAFAFTACDLTGGDSGDTDGTQTSGSGSEGTGTTPSESGEVTVTPPSGNESNSSAGHTHSYVYKITKPTQTTTGSVTGTCACGDVQTTALPALTDSKYIKTQDTATCTTKGEIKYTIVIDGATYMFTAETPTTAHNFVNGKCSVCGADDPDFVPHTHTYVEKSDASGHWTECACGDKTPLIAHSYTYEKNEEYHWQVCSVKGETTDKVLHTYNNGVCVCGAIEPVDPNGVQSITIQHIVGDGNYLWNEIDVALGKYNLYDATLKITRNSGEVSYEPITVDMLGLTGRLTAGNHSLTVTYGGKSTQFSVFVAPVDGYIEAVAGKSEIVGLDSDTLLLNMNDPSSFSFESLSIEGEFNVLYNGVTYSGYYGETPVNDRFVRNFDVSAQGLQECTIVAGNIRGNAPVLGEVNVMAYNSSATEQKVFVSDIVITRSSDASVVFSAQLVPGKPYLDLQTIEHRADYYEPNYSVSFTFKKGDFTEYSGGGDTAVTVSNIVAFNTYGYTVSGDTDLWSVLSSGERLIRISNRYEDMDLEYTVYNSDDTNIRICRSHGEAVLNYELTDGVTFDSIKKDLLTRELYVEYFEKVDGKYVHLVPITASMIDFDGLDENSYDLQMGLITFEGKRVAVNITKPYSITGATVLYTLKNTVGVNLILSDTTVNDLGQCLNDACKEIVLYSNGVALLKHTGNGIGNVLIGYKLDGNTLTLNRYGFITSHLTVNSAKTSFEAMSLDELTAGKNSVTYVFSHTYDLGGTIPIGWSGVFTAYDYDYSNNVGYVNVHLTGWASTANQEGYAYQIAGIEYVATWVMGWHNNKNAFVLRFADLDWWFEIGTADDTERYRLTFIQTSQAS